MKVYNILDWYWSVVDIPAQVYSSKLRNYVPLDDAAYVAWNADGSIAIRVDTEASLGGVFASYKTLRPIPQGVLDGYLDALTLLIAKQPDFALWVDLYQQVMPPLKTPQQVLDHIRTIL